MDETYFYTTINTIKMEPDNRDNKYLKAKKRVTELKEFYISLTSYVVFIIALGALNYYTNQWRYAWFLWAAFGWGIGIVFHALKVFGGASMFGKNWEERKMKQFMEEEEARNARNKF